MNHLLDMTPQELSSFLQDLGESKFRADQILDWIWRKGATEFEAMTNLSKALRAKLTGGATLFAGTVARRTDAEDGVVKLLLAFPDEEAVETVSIPTAQRTTACLSTQAGCAMGCAFCASGLGGLGRHLSTGEILEQVLRLQQQTGRSISNVVFMGTGEPLANYDATLGAVRGLIDPKRGGLSARKITVSTVGLPAQIHRLAEEDLPITLAISLHAPDDALRAELMPVAGQYPISEILDAAKAFYARRHREVTLEYTLLADVNDSPRCAADLAGLARRLRCNVNLIRYNPVSSLPFRAPEQDKVAAFAEDLRRRGVNVNVRRSRGRAADAACGQLRHEQNL